MPTETAYNALASAVWLLTPEMILAGFACLIFLGGTFVANRNLWGWVALIGLFAAILDAQQTATGPGARSVYAVPIVIDALAYFSRYVALFSGIVLLLLSWHELGDRKCVEDPAADPI